jgi:hypothetical protein
MIIVPTKMNAVKRFKNVMQFKPLEQLPMIEWAMWWEKTIACWVAVDLHEAQIAAPGGIIKIKLQRIKGHLVGQLEHPKQLVPVVAPSAAENEIVVRSY